MRNGHVTFVRARCKQGRGGVTFDDHPCCPVMPMPTFYGAPFVSKLVKRSELVYICVDI